MHLGEKRSNKVDFNLLKAPSVLYFILVERLFHGVVAAFLKHTLLCVKPLVCGRVSSADSLLTTEGSPICGNICIDQDLAEFCTLEMCHQCAWVTIQIAMV